MSESISWGGYKPPYYRAPYRPQKCLVHKTKMFFSFFFKHVNTHTHTHSEIGRKFSVGNCTAVALIALPARFRDQENWDLKTDKPEWSALGMRFVRAFWCSEGKLAKRQQPTSTGCSQGPRRKGTKYISLYQEPTTPVLLSSAGSVTLGSQQAMPVRSILIERGWW